MIIIIILYLLGTDKLCLPQAYFCSNNIDIKNKQLELLFSSDIF